MSSVTAGLSCKLRMPSLSSSVGTVTWRKTMARFCARLASKRQTCWPTPEGRFTLPAPPLASFPLGGSLLLSAGVGRLSACELGAKIEQIFLVSSGVETSSQGCNSLKMVASSEAAGKSFQCKRLPKGGGGGLLGIPLCALGNAARPVPFALPDGGGGGAALLLPLAEGLEDEEDAAVEAVRRSHGSSGKDTGCRGRAIGPLGGGGPVAFATTCAGVCPAVEVVTSSNASSQSRLGALTLLPSDRSNMS
mmetsp:Transcript_11786/g.26694  ORF Transcript_11786/g.26694 Transcript_11786/m.26694 type:complete len:249 (+) Transcript_11786:1258-2004(+)